MSSCNGKWVTHSDEPTGTLQLPSALQSVRSLLVLQFVRILFRFSLSALACLITGNI